MKTAIKLYIRGLSNFKLKCDSAYANFREYSSIFFYFRCKKNNFPNISALCFLNYFMPNMLPGYSISLKGQWMKKCTRDMCK